MTASPYNGPRLCLCCMRKAEVVVNTGRPEASNITLLCWSCADGLVGVLQELFAATRKEEDEAEVRA